MQNYEFGLFRGPVSTLESTYSSKQNNNPLKGELWVFLRKGRPKEEEKDERPVEAGGKFPSFLLPQ